mmetsp:Transcript_46147/g.103974  ORF Transcript_46147/g.103974 Transcript_46147/m.103974 type:complete len:220 (-) Transcript_46147:302-961(-)
MRWVSDPKEDHSDCSSRPRPPQRTHRIPRTPCPPRQSRPQSLRTPREAGSKRMVTLLWSPHERETTAPCVASPQECPTSTPGRRACASLRYPRLGPPHVPPRAADLQEAIPPASREAAALPSALCAKQSPGRGDRSRPPRKGASAAAATVRTTVGGSSGRRCWKRAKSAQPPTAGRRRERACLARTETGAGQGEAARHRLETEGRARPPALAGRAGTGC